MLITEVNDEVKTSIKAFSQLTSDIQTDVERKYLSFAFYHCLFLETVTRGLFVCLFSYTYERIKGKYPTLLKRECEEGS